MQRAVRASPRHITPGDVYLLLIVLAGAGLGACDLNPTSASGAGICAPNASTCTAGGKVRVCKSDGSAWLETFCPTGQTCVGYGEEASEGCPTGCLPIVCQPGAERCADDNLARVRCNATGTGWVFVESCAVAAVAGVCAAGQCIPVCTQDDKSYIGCSYFAVDLDNANVRCDRDPYGDWMFCDAAGSQFAVVVSNADPNRTAYVSVTRGPLSAAPPASGACGAVWRDPNVVDAAVIGPKGLHIFELPRRDVNGTVQARLAYRIASNIPITAYQFNPLENVNVFSNDASLLLPTNAVGRSYWVMTREQTFDDLKSYFTVVGIDRHPTRVTIRVTARTLAGPGIDALESGDERTFTLEAFDVLNIETNAVGADLTGSRIVADRPVVVFGGSEAANAPNTNRCDLRSRTCENDASIACGCDENANALCSPHANCTVQRLITCCADHLEQQLFPVSTWGNEYVAARSFPRGEENDVWRIMASEHGTEVVFDPPVATARTLGPGEWMELESGVDFIVRANHPILVGQFLVAQDAPRPGPQPGDAQIGDPAFILAVPVRQYRTAYVFLVPNKYAEDYATVIYRAGGAVYLDGSSVDGLPGALHADVGDSGWRAARVRVDDGYHELICADTCSAVVHGYDQYVSYGYPAGLNLSVEGTETPSTSAVWY